MSANLAANTNLEYTPPVSSISILVGLIVVVLLGVGATIAFHYYKLHESPWWSDRAKASSALWDWLDAFRSAPSFGQYGNLREVPSGFQLSAPVPTDNPNTPSPPANPSPTHTPSSSPQPAAWCFVGEDLTGRYCVKVPSAAACERTRVFNSLQDCELKSANALPAGVVSPHDGRKMTPLSSALLTP